MSDLGDYLEVNMFLLQLSVEKFWFYSVALASFHLKSL